MRHRSSLTTRKKARRIFRALQTGIKLPQKVSQKKQKLSSQTTKSPNKGDKNQNAQNLHKTTQMIHSSSHKDKHEYHYCTAKITNLCQFQ